MKKLLVAVLVAGIALLWGCADDIVLEGEAPLIGDYEGTYEVILNYGSAADTTYLNYVRMTFTETVYIMEIDTSNNTGYCFCRVDGQYALTNGVRLSERGSQPDGMANCQSCNEGYNPVGTFQRENQGNKLILKNINGTTFMKLELERVQVSDTTGS